MVVNCGDNRWATSNFIVAPTIAEGASYTTIAAAIAAASSGNTIFIKPGTYTENITLKSGVNLTAFGADSDTPNVIISGTCSFSAAGTTTLSNIRLQTNGATNVLSVTGSAASVVVLRNCYINCTANTGISYTTSNASSQISLQYCTCNLTTTGIALYSMSSTGNLVFFGCVLGNSGASTTANNNSEGQVRLDHSNSAIPFTTSSTGLFVCYESDILTNAINTACLTTSGTGSTNQVFNSTLFSGTASAISLGAGTTASVAECIISSSNTNAITGAGSINMGGLTFVGSSSNVNVTTQTIRAEGPSRTIGSSNTGATNTFTITNSSNTASSNALENITVGGTSAGDPFTTYTVSGTTNWSQGIDNSVTGDPFVLSASTALGTTNVMSAATAGQVNWPLQPCFLTIASLQSNVTGDATDYTIIYDTEIFDQGNNFDGTSTFTAPVTGRYLFCGVVQCQGLTAAFTSANWSLVTSNRTYQINTTAGGALRNANNAISFGYSQIVDMDAADTATMLINVSGGTKIVDVSTSNTFSGHLVA